MPLSKRIIFDAASISHPNLYEDSSGATILHDCNMSRILGSFHQLAYLSAYAAEVFDGLMLLSGDTHERIKNISFRTSLLYSDLNAIERGTESFNLDGHGHSGKLAKEKFLKNRQGYTLTVLVRNTNCRQLMSEYQSCNFPPQFWKLDAYSGGKDASLLYSNPGFFFYEWLKTEHLRQQTSRQERKRQKKLKKMAKLERKKKYLALIDDQEDDFEAPNQREEFDVYRDTAGDEDNLQPEEYIRSNDKKTLNFSLNKSSSKTIPRKKIDRSQIQSTAEDKEMSEQGSVSSERNKFSNLYSSMWRSVEAGPTMTIDQHANRRSSINRRLSLAPMDMSNPSQIIDTDPSHFHESKQFDTHIHNNNEHDDNENDDNEEDLINFFPIPNHTHHPTHTAMRSQIKSKRFGDLTIFLNMHQKKRSPNAFLNNNSSEDITHVEIKQPEAKRLLKKKVDIVVTKQQSNSSGDRESSNSSKHTPQSIAAVTTGLNIPSQSHYKTLSTLNYKDYEDTQPLQPTPSTGPVPTVLSTPLPMHTKLTVKDMIRRASISKADVKDFKLNVLSFLATEDTSTLPKDDKEKKNTTNTLTSEGPPSVPAFDYKAQAEKYATAAASRSASPPAHPLVERIKGKESSTVPPVSSPPTAKLFGKSHSDFNNKPITSSHYNTAPLGDDDDDDPPPPDDDDDLPPPGSDDDNDLPPPDDDDDDMPPPDDDDDDDMPPSDDDPPPDDEEDLLTPPVEEPKQPLPTSALSFNVLKDIQLGSLLRKVEPPPKQISARENMLSAIKLGGVSLKKNDPAVDQAANNKIKTQNQNVAVAAILANRSKIAGDSDSDSDQSDSNFSDDDYG